MKNNILTKLYQNKISWKKETQANFTLLSAWKKCLTGILIRNHKRDKLNNFQNKISLNENNDERFKKM